LTVVKNWRDFSWLDLASSASAGDAIAAAMEKAKTGKAQGLIIVGESVGALASDLAALGVRPWELSRTQQKNPFRDQEALYFSAEIGPVWVITLGENDPDRHGGNNLAAGLFARAKNMAGMVAPKVRLFAVDELSVVSRHQDSNSVKGVLVGLELGIYKYKNFTSPERARKLYEELPRLVVHGLNQTEILSLKHLAQGVNLARHLVNIPATDLTPKTYSQQIKELFEKSKHSKVTVLKEEDLKREKMDMLLAVGRGANDGARLVKISYRGPTAANKVPKAVIGKGVTFDTGGLDLKPAKGMRLMKKDMGGSAAVCGLGFWLAQEQPDIAVDLYLALAENAVDRHAYKPGDILQSRAGISVEIENTDAEGRLVLGDAMDFAQSAKEKPDLLIDVATLTGSMRVALGKQVCGMFANDEAWAEKMQLAARDSGDPMWRMPLYSDYLRSLESHVADISNSGVDGFAGSITAALFLQKFVKDIPWIHLDLYAWSDKPGFGYPAVGGTGQGVMMLCRLMSQFE
jgi:leucyl aminopeptidase